MITIYKFLGGHDDFNKELLMKFRRELETKEQKKLGKKIIRRDVRRHFFFQLYSNRRVEPVK